MQSDGPRATGRTSFTSAYGNDFLAQDAIDLSTRNETFYVLNAGGDATATADYTRYRFKTDGSVESAQFNKNAGTTTVNTYNNQAQNAGQWLYYGPFASTDRLQVTSNSGAGDADLYVLRGSSPTATTGNDCAS